MAIKNSIVLNGLQIAGAYTRITHAAIDNEGVEPKVTLTVADYGNEDLASKVLEDVYSPAKYFDPGNPSHKAQYDAFAADNDKREDWEELSQDWLPVEVEQKWLGKRKENPLQKRSVELPLELAIAIVTQTVPGANPESTTDNLISQVYRAAMLTGKFAEAESV